MALNQRQLWQALFLLLMVFISVSFLDKQISLALRTLEDLHPAIIDFFRSITHLGKSLWMLIGLASAAAISWLWGHFSQKQHYKIFARQLLFIFVCVALAGLVTDLLKIVFGRTRPVLLDQEQLYLWQPFTLADRYASFPSGHSTNAFALGFATLLLWPRLIAWLLPLVVAVALTRVMVNAHFLSDVLGGACVAWLMCQLFFHWPRLRQICALDPSPSKCN